MAFVAEPFYASPFGRSFNHHANTMNATTMLPSLPHKLPSLEGLLKRIHNEHHCCDSGASTDDESVSSASSRASSPSRVGVGAHAMPSLRSILSPQLLQHSRRSWDESSQSDAASDDLSGSLSPKPTSKPPQRSRASKFCKIDGCERVSQRNNLCHSHGGKRLCKEDGCVSKDRGNGFCIKHGGGKICSIGGCDKKARRKGLCTQHFRVCDSLSAPGMDALGTLAAFA